MRVLVTGAAGTLGRALLPLLVADGHAAVALDLQAADVEAEWVVGDVRDAEVVREAADGADLIVHGAALHGIHLGDHTPGEFYDLNVTGTFNVWQAAVERGVRGVVFSSTMGVYGDTRRPADEDEVVFLDESLPVLPGDVYGWTKVVGEELCRYHFRADGIPSVALRFGMFVPESFFRYGIRLLYGGVHEQDCALSVMAAIAALLSGRVTHEAVNVESRLPFSGEDSPQLRRDPLAAVERHYPGAAELLRSRGVDCLKPVSEVFPVSRLERALGYRPSHDFREWLDELRARPGEVTETNPPWP